MRNGAIAAGVLLGRTRLPGGSATDLAWHSIAREVVAPLITSLRPVRWTRSHERLGLRACDVHGGADAVSRQ